MEGNDILISAMEGRGKTKAVLGSQRVTLCVLDERREPPIGGVIVARASSEQELREDLTSDPFQQLGLAEYEVFAFEATDFPKRSNAFETFASKPLRELPPILEIAGPHAHE